MEMQTTAWFARERNTPSRGSGSHERGRQLIGVGGGGDGLGPKTLSGRLPSTRGNTGGQQTPH